MIRFVYFDLGNVIVNFSVERLLRQVADLAGVETDRVARAVEQGGLQFRYECGLIDETAYYETFCERIGTRPERAVLMQAICDIFTLNVPMEKVLQSVSDRGLARGILSNTDTSHWEYCKMTYPMIFKHIPSNHLLSFEVGAMKPDPVIYEAAYRMATDALPGVSPSEVLFIDDLKANILAACEFGFDGIHYTDDRLLLVELQKRDLFHSAP